MKLLLITSIFSLSLYAQDFNNRISKDVKSYIKEHEENQAESNSVGSVSNGSLENGKLIPYKGLNFMYFDERSYLEGRAFVHSTVKDIVLATYDELFADHPNRFFMIMECSNEHGGRMFPHKTHQNGLSIDFMMPMLKKGEPFYGLDTIGASHYFLSFNDEGKYDDDSEVEIDFDLVSKHIVLLNAQARKRGYEIKKVIIQIELKDELYAAEYGNQIKSDGIYVVRNLTTLINELHDDHYHIDFGPI